MDIISKEDRGRLLKIKRIIKHYGLADSEDIKWLIRSLNKAWNMANEFVNDDIDRGIERDLIS